MQDDGPGCEQSTGRGTHPGGGPINGGDGIRAGAGTASGLVGDVCNQQLLVFDRDILATLDATEARRLAIIQLRFARGVSRQAMIAYDSMLLLLGTDPDETPTD